MAAMRGEVTGLDRFGLTAADLRRMIQEVQEKLRARGYGEIGHIVEFFGVAPTTEKPAAITAAKSK